MKQGDRVKLISMVEVEQAAKILTTTRPTAGWFTPVVDLHVGMIGTVKTEPSPVDGLFQVAFDKGTIWCSASMIELVSEAA